MNAKKCEKNYTQYVYRNLIILGFLLHLFYMILFAVLGFISAMFYNLTSAAFYSAVLLLVIKKQKYAWAVSLIHIESICFVILMTILFGWDCAFYMFLTAMASLVYFCPFSLTYVPYLFSLLHITVFFLLRYYTITAAPLCVVRAPFDQVFFLYNCLGSFIMILYAAYVSRVSAAVGKEELLIRNHTLQELTNYDQLTGLYSRHYLRECHSVCENHESFLAIGDIDDFKHVNDTYGHICGDVILRDLAELMRKVLDPNAFLCRWGGEEFVFVFSNIDQTEAREQMNLLCDAVSDHCFAYHGEQIHITMTFGLAQGRYQQPLSQWIEQADELLYMGKREGKNRVK